MMVDGGYRFYMALALLGSVPGTVLKPLLAGHSSSASEFRDQEGLTSQNPSRGLCQPPEPPTTLSRLMWPVAVLDSSNKKVLAAKMFLLLTKMDLMKSRS